MSTSYYSNILKQIENGLHRKNSLSHFQMTFKKVLQPSFKLVHILLPLVAAAAVMDSYLNYTLVKYK